MDGFKPYYKWITFNTQRRKELGLEFPIVLNLIINGLPSILSKASTSFTSKCKVLNLIINGLPSIQNMILIF